MSEVFLSFAKQDQEMADRIAAAIESHGGSVVRDTGLAAGEDIQAQEDAIRHADVVVVLLSESMSPSRWVQSEVVNALEKKKRIIPVLLGANAKNNYVWSLVADRQAIEVGDMTSPAEMADKVSEIVLSTGQPDPTLYGLKF